MLLFVIKLLDLDNNIFNNNRNGILYHFSNLRTGYFTMASFQQKWFVLLLSACPIVLGTIIELEQGSIEGKYVKVDNNTGVYQFLQIPYAQPPVGNLRFQKPEPIKHMDGVHDATKIGPACFQKLSSNSKRILGHDNVSEDCLHLNIYVPHTLNPFRQKAVMVYVHGGGYYQKAGALNDGTTLALHGDVIVVTINYRLGAFGFLSTGDETIKGNFGLWDQIESFRWIQDSIEKFGGDKNNVTVFGHSAGGYSIGVLLMTPHSRGLFSRAILVGGSGLSPRAVTRDPMWSAIQVGKKAGCLNLNSTRENVNVDLLRNCFMNMSATDLLVASRSFRAEYLQTPHFVMRHAPAVDRDLVEDLPENILKKKDMHSANLQTFWGVDIMVGTAKYDGGLLKSSLGKIEKDFSFDLDKGVPTSAFCESIVPALARDYYEGNTKFTTAVCKEYSNNDSMVDQGISAITGYGAMMYQSAAVSTLRHHAKFSKKSAYHFIFSKKLSVPNVSLPPWYNGTYHGEYVPLLFGLTDGYSQDDKILSRIFMTYLSNFAKFG